jgi:hypothetical protein
MSTFEVDSELGFVGVVLKDLRNCFISMQIVDKFWMQNLHPIVWSVP